MLDHTFEDKLLCNLEESMAHCENDVSLIEMVGYRRELISAVDLSLYTASIVR